MKQTPKGSLRRCAIYTRKSSEEGLDQSFNSLQAQREACEAYIKSQGHEGWVCLPEAYDDGGISGGTMDRPALRQLLADIQSGRIAVVVVYKVDRLTRSLADFARIIDIFDAKGVSFVSITQQFNTTSSMGRLTLNVLLSFAQFEREVTGERIRDKIAASKAKGMWMGGLPPMGYTAKDGKLLVALTEVETVRHIFRRYLDLGSVRALSEDLQAQGIRSSSRISTAGKSWGGRTLARGALYRMLQNRIYRGAIVHKDKCYPGEHAAIVEPELWQAVQDRLAANGIEHKSGSRAKHPSLLVGRLFAPDGARLTPSHAVKNGKRYRYYVSQRLTDGRSTGTACRVPAAEIEQVVTHQIRRFLADAARILAAVEIQVPDAARQRYLIEESVGLARSWDTLPPVRQRAIILMLLARIDLHQDKIDIGLFAGRIVAVLEPGTACPTSGDEPVTTVSVAACLKHTGVETKMIIDGHDPYALPSPDPNLIRLLVQAHDLRDKLVQGHGTCLTDVATREKITPSYFTRLLRLSYLAPDITQSILEGSQPVGVTAAKLLRHSRLPLDWQDQRALLGFV